MFRNEPKKDLCKYDLSSHHKTVWSKVDFLFFLVKYSKKHEKYANQNKTYSISSVWNCVALHKFCLVSQKLLLSPFKSSDNVGMTKILSHKWHPSRRRGTNPPVNPHTQQYTPRCVCFHSSCNETCNPRCLPGLDLPVDSCFLEGSVRTLGHWREKNPQKTGIYCIKKKKKLLLSYLCDLSCLCLFW